MRTEFLWCPSEGVTKVYLWKGMTLLDKEIIFGEVSVKERGVISKRMIDKATKK